MSAVLTLMVLAAAPAAVAAHLRQRRGRRLRQGGADPTPRLRAGLTRALPTWFPAVSEPADVAGEALLYQISGVLRGGMPAEQAWQSVGIGTTAQGLPCHGDLVAALSARPTPDVARQAQGVVVAARLAQELGVPLAGLLTVVAGTVENSQRAVAERERALAGPAATARVLLWLPLLGIFFGAVLGAQPLDWLVGGPLGWVCLLAGLGLLLAGRMWTKKLMARALTEGSAP